MAPGTRQAYHAVTLGYYENELLRRIDPRHRSLGQFFQDEIATPLGLDVYIRYIRLPEDIPNSRLATITRPSFTDMLRGFPLRLALDAMNRRSNISRALRGSELPHDEQCIYARNLEIPSGGAVGTARAIARAYSAFATGASELGLRRETLELLAAPAVPPARGFYDECMKAHGIQFSLGFMKSTPALPFGGSISFGSPGAGGSMGFADPIAGVRLRVRHKRHGHAADRRPTRRGSQRRALFVHSGSTGCVSRVRRGLAECEFTVCSRACASFTTASP